MDVKESFFERLFRIILSAGLWFGVLFWRAVSKIQRFWQDCKWWQRTVWIIWTFLWLGLAMKSITVALGPNFNHHTISVCMALFVTMGTYWVGVTMLARYVSRAR